jgi:predicted aminopeptidase
MLLAAPLLLAACTPGYVLRAAYEEGRILWKREPIVEVLKRGDLPKAEREKLELVLDVRRFAAEELGFRVGGSYGSVSRLDHPAVVHVVTAARRDRLEPVTWWFPIVGRVPYQGFFSKSSAETKAARLEKQGYDTYLRPSIAFSTLGWFDDPLLSTLLKLDAPSLAEVVLHELFHNTLFRPGQMAFNESAAVFAGNRGTIEYFCRRKVPAAKECAAAEARWRDLLRYSTFIGEASSRLEALYGTPDARDSLTLHRTRAFAELRDAFRQLPLETDRYDDFADGPLNNAVLMHERTYFSELNVFNEFYRRNGGLRPTIQAMRDALTVGGNPFQALQDRLEREEPAQEAAVPLAYGSRDSSRRIP